MQNCPHSLKPEAVNCLHCKPEEAPCVLACQENAFFESAEGVLSIDETLCSGCGKCNKACPEKAIVLQKKKAAKCDLCSGQDFVQACVGTCPNSSISIERTREEIEQAEKALGWRIFKPKKRAGRTLLKKEGHSIKERGSEKWYEIEEFPELSMEEAMLLREIIERFQSDSELDKSAIPKAMDVFLEENRIELDERQKEYFLGIMYSLVNGFGPVSLLLEDEALEEIALIGTGKNKPLRVFHRLFGWCKCNVYFSDTKSVVNTVNRMLLKTDRRLSLSNPRVNGVLPDGSRLNATIPPVSFAHPSVTIRKFNSKKFTCTELTKNSTVSTEAMAFLSLALETDCSLLIAGNTGSGKTTTLNALFSFVPENERIVLIEETPELQIPHSHSVKLNVAERQGITMTDLIVDSLRMRPDRIVVGEIRSRKETEAFIDTLLAGQGKGSYATFHAGSVNEAIKRLVLLGVKEIDLCSIDLVVVQRRWDSIARDGSRRELRRVIEIAEISERSGLPKVNSLFKFNYSKGKLERKGKSEKVKLKVKRAFSFSEKAFAGELAKRKKEIEKAKK